MEVDVTFRLANYIGHPYLAELERVITIQRDSGMNRARSAENRAKALNQHLEAEGMTIDDYERLVEISKEQWITNARGHIVITPHQFGGMLAQAAKLAKAANRLASRDSIRALVRTSAFETDRTEA